MASLNRIEIIGNLGTDPKMAFLPSGSPVTEFRVATHETTKDGERTEWFGVVCYDKLAETTNQYLTKGSLVYVSGRQRTRSWENDQETRTRVELIASMVEFLDKPPRTTDGQRQDNSTNQSLPSV